MATQQKPGHLLWMYQASPSLKLLSSNIRLIVCEPMAVLNWCKPRSRKHYQAGHRKQKNEGWSRSLQIRGQIPDRYRCCATTCQSAVSAMLRSVVGLDVLQQTQQV